MSGGRFLEALSPGEALMIWRNMDGIEDFYRFVYQGLLPVSMYQYPDESRVYYTREQLESLMGERVLVLDDTHYLVPEDYELKDVREDLSGQGLGLVKQRVGETELHSFVPDDPELKPVMVPEVKVLLSYGVRECDGLTDFMDNPRTGNHYPYNRHAHPEAQLWVLDQIDASRQRNSLIESRSDRLHQGVEKGHDLPPVRVTSDGKIIDGHHRYYLSLDWGYTVIPVLI